VAAHLERIVLRFPGTDCGFAQALVATVEGLGRREGSVRRLSRSQPGFYPELLLDPCSDGAGVVAEFRLSDGQVLSLAVENTTGVTKASPHAYTPVRLEAVRRRLDALGARVLGIDHAGVNLPWFSGGVHPRIGELRERLRVRCLYHRFPTGEPWDFILPGDEDEIAGRRAVDYARVRRPKFELVSFAKASTPLVQFDVGVNVGYERLAGCFPEALPDPGLGNLWVYLEAPYPLDVCLVIGEAGEGDWSDFFDGFRL
jgi:hypothetical protein